MEKISIAGYIHKYNYCYMLFGNISNQVFEKKIVFRQNYLKFLHKFYWLNKHLTRWHFSFFFLNVFI